MTDWKTKNFKDQKGKIRKKKMHSEWTVLYETWTIVFKTVKLHIVLVFCGKTLYSFMWNLKRVFGIVVNAII